MQRQFSAIICTFLSSMLIACSPEASVPPHSNQGNGNNSGNYVAQPGQTSNTCAHCADEGRYRPTDHLAPRLGSRTGISL